MGVWTDGRAAGTPVPGAVLVLENGVPVCRAIAVGEAQIRIGRADGCVLVIHDPMLSREHLLLTVYAALLDEGAPTRER